MKINVDRGKCATSTISAISCQFHLVVFIKISCQIKCITYKPNQFSCGFYAQYWLLALCLFLLPFSRDFSVICATKFSVVTFLVMVGWIHSTENMHSTPQIKVVVDLSFCWLHRPKKFAFPNFTYMTKKYIDKSESISFESSE